MTRRFTGRHMLALMVTFFGTVIAVNVTMATLAARTFGGTVVKNSYVATREFNGWLRQARAEAALGWNVRLLRDGDGVVAVVVHSAGAPLRGAQVRAIARHPVGGEDDVRLSFEGADPGRYRSTTRLPGGRWLVQVEIRKDGHVRRALETLS